MQWVELLPDTQTPSWLGLPNNAERVLLTTQGGYTPPAAAAGAMSCSSGHLFRGIACSGEKAQDPCQGLAVGCI